MTVLHEIFISFAAASATTVILLWKMARDRRRATTTQEETATAVKTVLDAKEKSVGVAATRALDEHTRTITAAVETSAVVTQAKAEAAYEEANSVNMKIEKLSEHLAHLEQFIANAIKKG
jgi:hypothetical protein